MALVFTVIRDRAISHRHTGAAVGFQEAHSARPTQEALCSGLAASVNALLSPALSPGCMQN